MSKKKYKNVAVILAGGVGKRMGSKVPKQFLKLGDKTILYKTIEVFKKSKVIDKVIITLPKEIIKKYKPLIEKYGFKDFVTVIEGGTTRQMSSFNALSYIKEIGGCDIVLIHDAVRPFINSKLIKDSIKLALKYGACEVVVPSIDTIVEVKNNFISKVLNRKNIYHTQTPQTFKFNLIYDACIKALNVGIRDATDDASLIIRLNKKVAIVRGIYENIKITSIKDYKLAKIQSKKK